MTVSFYITILLKAERNIYNFNEIVPSAEVWSNALLSINSWPVLQRLLNSRRNIGLIYSYKNSFTAMWEVEIIRKSHHVHLLVRFKIPAYGCKSRRIHIKIVYVSMMHELYLSIFYCVHSCFYLALNQYHWYKLMSVSSLVTIPFQLLLLAPQ